MGRKKTDSTITAPGIAFDRADAVALATLPSPSGAECRERAMALATSYGGEMLEVFSSLDVLDEESLALAGEGIKEVRSLRNALEAERKRGTDPLRKVVETIRGWFKPAESALEQCESVLKIKVSEYLDARREINAEAVRATAEAAVAGDVRGATEALAEIAPEITPQGIGTQRRWTFRCSNLGMVPAAYLELNEKAVREAMHAAVKAGQVPGDTFLIPGVVFSQEESLTVRA